MHEPLISIVTPVYNQVEFIERTINSVLSQSYTNIEYIIVDGNSNDGTKDIINKYKDKISHYISEDDSGMYDALNKGLQLCTGDIMCYLNADDIYYPGTLDSVADIFTNLKIDWLTGIASSIDENDRIVGVANSTRWSLYKFYSGNYKWIQQESTFWSKELWEMAGGEVNKDYKLAGDFDLWCRFFKHKPLYTVNTILGGFRWRSKNQLSLEGIGEYEKEAATLIDQHAKSLEENDIKWINKIKKYKGKKSSIPFLNRAMFKTDQEWYKYPAVIRFDRLKQAYYLK